MSWAKLDDGFFRHPKARAAGRDGRALFVAGLCWAASHLTDGFIATAELGLIAAEAEVRARPTMRRLVEVGLWEPTEGGWVIHDYLVFNPTAEAEREKRRKRAEAGRKGGLRSRPGRSKREANASANAPPIAEADTQAETKQIGTPSPSLTEDLTSSDVLTTGSDPPDDDRRHQQRLGATIAVLAHRDLDERQRQAQLPPVADPATWTRRAEDRRRERHAEDLERLARTHPDATPEQLANLIDNARTEPARRTADGTPFMPGIGAMPGPSALPDLDPSVSPDWAAMRASTQQPHRSEAS